MSLQADLRDLFERDSTLRALRSRLDAGLRRQRLQQKKLDDLQGQADEVQTEIKKLRAKVHDLETDSQAANEKLDAYGQQMSQVKNNKEYSALLVEANTLKEAKAGVDDETLQLMGQIEGFEGRGSGVQQQIEEQRKLLEITATEVAEAQDEVGEQVDAMSRERDTAAGKIPGDVLAQYEQLWEDTDGEAVAMIEEQDRKRREYTCSGCFMALPVEHVNRVLTKPDVVTQCSSCDRILLISEDIKTELAPS